MGTNYNNSDISMSEIIEDDVLKLVEAYSDNKGLKVGNGTSFSLISNYVGELTKGKVQLSGGTNYVDTTPRYIESESFTIEHETLGDTISNLAIVYNTTAQRIIDENISNIPDISEVLEDGNILTITVGNDDYVVDNPTDPQDIGFAYDFEITNSLVMIDVEISDIHPGDILCLTSEWQIDSLHGGVGIIVTSVDGNNISGILQGYQSDTISSTTFTFNSSVISSIIRFYEVIT